MNPKKYRPGNFGISRLTGFFILALITQQCGDLDESDKFMGKWIHEEFTHAPETHFIEVDDENYDRILEITFFLNATMEEANGSYEASCDCLLLSNDNILYFDNLEDQIVFENKKYVREESIPLDS